MKRIDNKSELATILTQKRRVLSVFYSSWCPFCQDFLPSFNQGVEIGYFDIVLHVVVDDYDNPLWEEYSIEAVPTVILFEQGNVAKRLDGRLGQGLSEKEFCTWLRSL